MTEAFPIYLIALIPLVTGAFVSLRAHRLKKSTAWALSLLSLCLSVLFFVWAVVGHLLPLIARWDGLSEAVRVFRPPHPRVVSDLGAWFGVGTFEISFGFALDTLATAAVGAALTVGLAIVVYFRGLSWGPRVWVRQLGAVVFTAGAVLLLVLADNLGLAFGAWVLVGVGATLLVGSGTLESEAAEAARSTWLLSRLGDVMLFLALLVVTLYARRLSYVDMQKMAWVFSYPENRPLWNLKPGFIFTALVAGAALCRSAQFPFHFWLARGAKSTGVATAALLGLVAPTGLFMVLRLNFVVSRSPVPLVLMGAVSGVSALLLALSSSAQHTLRRAVGYLGSAQIGVALAVVGVGGYTAGMFLLATVSLAAAGIALAAGTVEGQNNGVSDVRELGGLWGRMPKTATAFVLSGLSLVGLWPLASGRTAVQGLELALVGVFKRTPGIVRLEPAASAPLRWALFFVLIVALLVASFSAARLFFRVFTGRLPRQKTEGSSELEEAGGEEPGSQPGGPQEAGAFLWFVPLVLGMLASGLGVLWALTGHGSGGGFFNSSGLGSFSRFLRSSLPTQGFWIVRETFLHPGAKDLFTPVGWIRPVLSIGLLLGVVGAVGVAGFFFKGRPHRLGGRLISAPGYRPFYHFIHRDLGVGGLLRFWSERLLPILGWVERSLGETLLVDWLLTRVPVSIVQLVGWLATRMQRWKRRGSLAAALVGLAALAVLAARPAQGVDVLKRGRRVVFHVSGLPQWPAAKTGPQAGSLPWEVRWDFDGDGEWDRRGLSVEHRYREPGAHEVVVDVRDRRWNTRARLKTTVRIPRSTSGLRGGRDKARVGRPPRFPKGRGGAR